MVSTVDDEVITGAEGDDMLTAAHDNVTLNGGLGNDVLFSEQGAEGTTMDGGSGNDTLAGGGTNDTASYVNDLAGVVVDLSNYSAIDGDGGTDILVGIENVTGSGNDDALTGDDLANVLEGDEGNDTLTGNGGKDVFKYSFDLTQGAGNTFSFTQFFANHGGTVVGGEVADGTSQGQFSSLYTQWLKSLGLTVLDLGQNSGPDGMPVVDGADGTFGERESFTWTSGSAKNPVVHERWYSDTWSTGHGQDAVTSGDGDDTILDFANSGDDVLRFDFTADDGWDTGMSVEEQLDFLQGFFAVASVDSDGEGGNDSTKIGVDEWSTTLNGQLYGDADADGFSDVFSHVDIYVNDALIG